MLHLDAGKYALFLWPAYALSAAVLLGIAAQTLLSARRWRREAQSKSNSEGPL